MSDTLSFFFNLTDKGGTKQVSQDLKSVEQQLAKVTEATRKAEAQHQALTRQHQKDALSKFEAQAQAEKDVGKRAELERKSGLLRSAIQASQHRAELAAHKTKYADLQKLEQKNLPFASTAEGLKGALKPLSSFSDGLLAVGVAAGPLLMIAGAASQIAGAFWNAAVSVGSFYVQFAQFAAKQTEAENRTKANFDVLFGGRGGQVRAGLDRVGEMQAISKEQRYAFGEAFAGTGVSDRIIENELLRVGSLTAGGDRSKIPELGKLIASSFRGRNRYETVGAGELSLVEQATGGKLNESKFIDVYARLTKQSTDAARIGVKMGLTKETFRSVVMAYADELDAQARGDLANTIGGYGVDRATKSLDDQLSITQERFAGLFKNVDLQPAVDFLRQLNTLLDTNSDSGKRFQQVVDGAFGTLNKFFEQYKGEDGAKKLREDFNKVLTIVEKLANALEKLVLIAGKLTGIGIDVLARPDSAAGVIARTSVGAVPGYGTLLSQFFSLWDSLGGSAKGPAFAEGGLVLGPVHNATVGEAGPELIIPLSKLQNGSFGFGGGQPITVNVPITIGHATPETAEAIQRELQTALPSILAPVIDRMAAQAGAR